jgi:hypothetical protein
MTRLDLLDFPTILFYETGYSICTLRQASRRSGRIAQWRNVKVKFFTTPKLCRKPAGELMDKKLLVSLAREGNFSTDGLQATDDGDDTS